MGGRHRDAGFVRAVGPVALAAGIVNFVVGGGIFVAPAALAQGVGAWAPLVFLVCALAVGCVAICFAEAGSRVPTSGGAYGTIEAALGPLAGYVAGTLLWVSDLLACGGIAAALADAAVTPLPQAARGAVHAAVVVAAVVAVALVNLAGVRRAAQLASVTAAIKLVPLVLFVCVGATAVRGAAFTDAPPPSTAGFGRALILALFAFMGMESALGASGEVARPSRTIPRALALAMATAALLFVGVQLVAQGLLGGTLARSPAPLVDALGAVHPAWRGVMLVGTALSLVGYLGSDMLASPRIVFALAHDGWLPRGLAAVHPQRHVPHVAIVAYAAAAIALALTGRSRSSPSSRRSPWLRSTSEGARPRGCSRGAAWRSPASRSVSGGSGSPRGSASRA